MFARYRRNARTQLPHVALFYTLGRGQRFESKDDGGFMPVVSVEAAKTRRLSRPAWTRSIQNGFPFALRLAHRYTV